MPKRTHLLMMLPLLLSACPRQADPGTAAVETPIADQDTQEDTSAIAGAYLCEFGQNELTPAQSCVIREDGGIRHFEMKHSAIDGVAHTLVGTLSPTAYGFRLQGSFDSEEVEIDVMRQGAWSFAAVLQLADQSLYKLNLRPATED